MPATTVDTTAHSDETARISLRTSREAKALIERAATLMGTTVSGFMLQSAYEAAQRAVATSETLLLSQRAFDAFVAAGDKPAKPAKPNKALRALMSRRR